MGGTNGMQRVEWGQEFEIGIKVIDSQHRRIVDYINSLVDMGDNGSHQEIAGLLEALLDYTYSHFAFEEALMEEAGYEFIAIHQNTHEAFSRRIRDLHDQFRDGRDVSGDLCNLLRTWLIDHIQNDDQSYAPVVKAKYHLLDNKSNGSWISNTLRRFFP